MSDHTGESRAPGLGERAVRTGPIVATTSATRQGRARIACICSALITGGAERQWAVLLPRLRQRGFQPELVTLTGRGRFFDEIVDAGIPATCAEMRSRYDMRRAYRAIRLASTPIPDIVMTHETNAHVIGHIVARRHGVPHVMVDHQQVGAMRKGHRRVLSALVARRASLAIALNEAQRQELANAGFPSDRIRLIPNGVPAPEDSWDTHETRRELGLASDDFVALLVAAMRPEKRAPLFVDAVSAANGRNPRIRGLVAGGGTLLETVKMHAENTGDVVQVLGERSDVPRLMAAADVVCLTSTMEGLPMVVLEAMASSRAVLVTQMPAIGEVVEHGVTGVIVGADGPAGIADALVVLAADPSRVASMGLAGRARYDEEYSADRMADRYSDVLREAMVVGASRSGTSSGGELSHTHPPAGDRCT